MAGRNFGTQRRRKERLDTDAAYADLQSDQQWHLPEDTPIIESHVAEEFVGSESKIITSMKWTDQWQLCHYSIVHEVKLSGRWTAIFRSDSAHDLQHRHEKLPHDNAKSVIRAFEKLEDIQVAFEEELQYVHDTVETRVQTWGVK